MIKIEPKRNFIFLLLAFIVFFFVKLFFDKNKFKDDGVYTIGTITKLGYGEAGAYCKYSYMYNGNKYIQNGSIGNHEKPKIGNKYLVVFLRELPYYSRIVLEAPINKEQNKNFPSEGWDTIPFGISPKVISKAISGNGYRFWD